MKILKGMQIALFILLVGFAGGWENGDVSDYVFAIEGLSIAVIILSLQLVKCRIKNAERKVEERNARRLYNNYQLTTINYQLDEGRSN